MIYLQEFIKLRTELNRELTHLELDMNLQFVSNPWNPKRKYTEGMVVYHGTPTNTGSESNLTWFRAISDNGPSVTIDPSVWEPIGANSISGNIFLENSANFAQIVSTIKFDDNFIINYTGSTGTITLAPNAFNLWQQSNIDSSTIYYDHNVLIGGDTIVSPSYKLTVLGNQLITGDLNVSGLIDGINLTNFYNDYVLHTHTLIPTTLTNYAALFPNSNGQLADVDINLGTLTTGQVLTWDSTLKRWVNSSVSSGAQYLGQLLDVSPTVTSSALNLQMLVYDSTLGKWKNVTVVPDSNTGFATPPLIHNHDARYWTKTQLSTTTGPIVNWTNIFNAPVIAPSDATYVVMSLTGNLSNERALTPGTGISIADNGPNNTVVISVIPGTTSQLISIEHNAGLIGIQPIVNFLDSGQISFTVTNNPLNNSIDISASSSFIAPVLSVNGLTGNVNLSLDQLINVGISPLLFPGPGHGTPFSSVTNILAYNDNISKWVNVPIQDLIAGISGLHLYELLDVEITPSTLGNNNILFYNTSIDRWISGTPEDAGMYTIVDLQTGALNSLYYTKNELITSGDSSVNWGNIIDAPNFMLVGDSFYLYQILDVHDYHLSPPNNGDVLTWNSTFNLWYPQAGGGGGFSTVINNSSLVGTFDPSVNITLTPSNINPLKFQSSFGTTLETDATNNIVKIGLNVDSDFFTYNSSGQLTLIVPDTGNCFEFIISTVTAGIPVTVAHPLGTDALSITVYDENNFIIDASIQVTGADITIEVARDLTNVRIFALTCASGLFVGGGHPIDKFQDLVTPVSPLGPFSDGVYDWQNNTLLVDAFYDLNKLLKALVPPPAPSLSDWSGTKAGLVANGKLSFDTSHIVPSQNYFGANVAPINPISVDGSWLQAGYRLGIAPVGGDVSGILNYQVTLSPTVPTPAYGAQTFGDADQGHLNLFLNGVLVSTIDLTSSTGSIDSTSGGTISGMTVSAQVSSFFSSGIPFTQFQNRTGSWLVKASDVHIRQGYNYMIVQHISGSFTRTLTRYEFILDDNVTATVYSSASLHGLSMTGSKYLSGIEYNTGGTALYNINLDNMYKNTYSLDADAISHTGNSNTYGLLLTAPVQALANCAGNQGLQVNIVNKVATITPSGIRIIDGPISLTTNAKRTVQGNTSGGTSSIIDVLVDNFPSAATQTFESFDDEVYRLNTNSNYDLVSDITSGGNIWTSTQSLIDGSAGHTTGLQVIDGNLVYPGKNLSYPSDFRTSNIINGPIFNDGGFGGAGRNYGPASGNRTYYRWFRQVSPTTANFILNIAGSGGTFVPLTTSLTTNNIHVEIKGPTQTGWMDAYADFVTNQWSDGSGARNASSGSGQAFNTPWGITIGTKSTANTSGYMLIRITVGPSFSGKISSLTWTFN